MPSMRAEMAIMGEPGALRPRLAWRYRSVGAIAVVMAVTAFVVVEFANAYWITTFSSAMALALAAAGVAVLYGQLGLVSLCQYALLGVGGWVALRVSHGFQPPFELCLL